MRKGWMILLAVSALALPSAAQDEEIGADGGEEVVEDFENVDDADFADVGDASEEEFQEFAGEEEPSDEDLPVAEEGSPAPEDGLEPLSPEESPREPIFAEPAPAAPEVPDTETPPSFADSTAGSTPLWDEPDLEYEARLYDIYVNYHAKPLSDSEWSKLLADRTVENYVIQRGDNLWSISETLFGDGNYWPKIWSLNNRITNPHLIKPKNTIRFFLGDESGPPAFTVSEAEGESVEPDQPETTQEPEIPPPTVRTRPVVKRLPPSLPQWQDPTSVNQNFDDVGIDYGKRKIVDVIDAIPLSSYVVEEPPEELGRVQEIETGHAIAASLQYVYVTIKNGGDIGDVYLAVQDRGPIRKLSKHIVSDFDARGIEVLGEIQLVEKVKGENESKHGQLYRALVTKIVNPVQVGAILTAGRIEEMNLTENGPKSQVVAQIVGGQLSNQRQVYAPESIAYLNRGERHGLQPGQLLPIRANRKLRNENSMVLGNVRSIGWLKIIKTTPNMATAVILRTWSDVLTGDFTGAGEMMPASSIGNNVEESDAPVRTSLLDELEGGGAPPADAGDEDFGDEDFSEDEFNDEF